MITIALPFKKDTYTARRQGLCTLLPDSKLLLLGNKRASINYRDNGYRFRQDSSFLYYIGINVPNLVAIIDTGTGETIIYGDEANIDAIIWTGPKTSISEQAEWSGISKVLPRQQLEKDITSEIQYLPPYRGEHTLLLRDLLKQKKLSPSLPFIKAIIEQRNVKSEEEILHMELAVKLSNQMHQKVIAATKAGLSEYQLCAEAEHYAISHNVNLAYSAIITTNGQILHNHDHHNILEDGRMVLNDSGVELSSGYCGDITRTFPVGSKYSTIQKELYQIVHNAYKKARELSAPGVKFLDVHMAAAREIAAGLIAIGWMKGDADEAVAEGAHTLFFQHGLGHMIGMDVHDMENLGEKYVGYDAPHKKFTEFGLKSLRLARALEPGNCFTIEPGLYIIPDLIDKRQSEGAYSSFVNYGVVNKYRDTGGIRLEDNFLITSEGNRILDGSLPSEAESLEELKKELTA